MLLSFDSFALILTSFSRVTKPKMSISREILSLMNLLVPFLIAMTLPFSMSLAESPLKNALADPV